MRILSVLIVLFAVVDTCMSSSNYASICDSVWYQIICFNSFDDLQKIIAPSQTFCRILDDSYKEINSLKNTVSEGSCIPNFGLKADQLCISALERFASEAPIPDDSRDNEALYDKKIDDLEKLLDAPLHVVYLKQLSLVRERSIKTFKQALTSVDNAEFEAMMKADEQFRREAEEATRQNPDWSYSKEIASLKASLSELAARTRKITEVKLKASKENSKAMQFLQMQQQQLQAIQQQVAMPPSPWNIGMSYRVPDTNLNVQCNYQQGKGNVQINCVPEEGQHLLGPSGFVHGVTPGNLGVSFNINI